MPRNILIVEDNVSNDLRYYLPLIQRFPGETSLFFLAPDKDYTDEKLKDSIDLFYGKLPFKHYVVRTKETAAGFLAASLFDLYIVDSLGGFAESLIIEASLPQNRIAFFSSTQSFRAEMQGKGYRAYKKEEIETLIADCLAA